MNSFAFISCRGCRPRKGSNAGVIWEKVNKRILPQITCKAHVLRREAQCTEGL